MNDNSTFCILAWVHTHIKPNGDVHLCSRKSIPLGYTHKQPFDVIFNSDTMSGIRTKMLNGTVVGGCEKCYQTEEISEVSLRKLSNWWFKNLLLDNIVQEWKDDTIYDGTDYDYDWIDVFKYQIRNPKLEWLALHASNICNLSCRGCYSMLSSKWKKDEIELGINPYPLFNNDLDAFGIDWKKIRFITMFGGEPLLMKQHNELVDFINSRVNVENKILQYYTNGTVYPSESAINAWSKIKKLQLFISIDGYEEVNDYFRHGSEWQIIKNNIKRFINGSKKYSNWELRISTLINIYNVEKLDVLHNWLIQEQVKESNINYNLCIYPQELDIRNLPAEYKETILKKYKTINIPKNIIDTVVNHINLEPTISFIASSAFSNKLDEIRNETNPINTLKLYMNE